MSRRHAHLEAVPDHLEPGSDAWSEQVYEDHRRRHRRVLARRMAGGRVTALELAGELTDALALIDTLETIGAWCDEQQSAPLELANPGESWRERAARREAAALEVACPYCEAPPGAWCVTSSGRASPDLHSRRYRR